MTKKTVLSSLASFSVAGVVILSSQLAHAETGRYTMTPTKDGVLKLDTRTGAVSQCRLENAKWRCISVEENDRGLRKKIERLERENEELRAQLETRKTLPGTEGGKLELPSEEDVDKAMDFMERMIERFRGMMEGARKGKTDENGVPL